MRCAGESRSQYRAVHDGVIDEEKPQGLREFFLTEQVAFSAWKARRLRHAEISVWNAGIANDLHRKLVTLEAFGVAAGEKKTGKYKIWWEDSVKAKTGNGWLAWHQIAVAAVSGDKSALAIVEGKLGPGAVAIINASSEFDTILTSQTLIDRSMTAALADRDSGYRQLDKIAARRAKKNKKIKRDAAALFQIDAIPVATDAATPDDPSLIADVPLRSAAKNESQPGPSSSVTVLVPPTLKKEA
jgi:hypothetical protein